MLVKKPLSNVALRNQAGSTLIEVLIAILIFGLGMLGMLGLLAATAKYQSNNSARAGITLSIESLSERIRSNVAAANGASSRDPVTNAPLNGVGYMYSTTFALEEARSLASFWPPALDCMTTACTPVQREAYDMLAWRAQLKQSLPGGSGVVSGNVTTGFNTTIMWFDKTAVQGDDAQFTDTLQANQVCDGTENPNSAAARFCCPAAVAAPDGARCYNTTIIP
jgi:type IV pilus assembly protein PilV